MIRYRDMERERCSRNGKPKPYTLTLSQGGQVKQVYGFWSIEVANQEAVAAFCNDYDILLEKNVNIEPAFESGHDPKNWSWSSEKLWTLTHAGVDTRGMQNAAI